MSETEKTDQEDTSSPAQEGLGLVVAEEPEGPARPHDLTVEDHLHNRAILEALLMASDAPLQVGRLLPALDGAGAREVRAYVDELNAEYASAGRAFRIVEVAGGFQFAVERRYAPFVRRLLRDRVPVRLSQAALETLSVIAFKQPITKAEIEAIRGVGVDWVLRTLLEHNLARIAGRSEGVGRPLLYGTTREFLRHFGLRTIADLPKLRELDELLKEGERNIAPDGPSGASDGQSVAEGTTEPVSGAGGSGVQAEERPADPGGPGDRERDDRRGPGDGGRP
jgi:segregation and condensation protein B